MLHTHSVNLHDNFCSAVVFKALSHSAGISCNLLRWCHCRQRSQDGCTPCILTRGMLLQLDQFRGNLNEWTGHQESHFGPPGQPRNTHSHTYMHIKEASNVFPVHQRQRQRGVCMWKLMVIDSSLFLRSALKRCLSSAVLTKALQTFDCLFNLDDIVRQQKAVWVSAKPRCVFLRICLGTVNVFDGSAN